ncbi:MAG: cysteine peptidase family C39 domain-containing protein, partial [Sulfurimonadaceae bacterium]|nr:cysteine peptidase family C39 domain-containing protein [Sulfurimonadaceae bacterium]
MPLEESFEQSPLLKCVKNILDFHFGDISFKTLSAFFIKSETFDSNQALEIFKNFNLNAIEKNISAESIANHFLPSIILDTNNNPLVYLKKSHGKATVFDPEDGEEKQIDIKKLKTYQKALLIFKDTKHIKYLESTENKAWFYEPLKAHYRAYVEIGII